MMVIGLDETMGKKCFPQAMRQAGVCWEEGNDFPKATVGKAT